MFKLLKIFISKICNLKTKNPELLLNIGVFFWGYYPLEKKDSSNSLLIIKRATKPIAK